MRTDQQLCGGTLWVLSGAERAVSPIMLSTLHRPFMVLRSSGENTAKEHGQLLVQSNRVALSRIRALVAGIRAGPCDDGLRSCVGRALPILRPSGMHASGGDGFTN